ncbi:hypothetical protein JNZ24_10835 [Streptococcus suis]|nr:hypothetical protein [Streptococcus suis]
MSHGQKSKKKEGKKRKLYIKEQEIGSEVKQNNIKERKGYREKGQQRKRSE